MLNRSEKPMALVSEGMTDKIMHALKVLDEAASEKGQDIKATIDQSFKDLHHALTDVESKSDEAMTIVQKKGRHLREVVENKSSKAISSINHQFRNRPWMFIGGAALIAIGVGYLVARNQRARV